jgi:hypothetical protein
MQNLPPEMVPMPFMEPLENRTLLSAALPRVSMGEAVPSAISAEAVSRATKTTLHIQSGSLGQAITFTVTVQGAASLGSPTGTVNLLDHNLVIQTLMLSPATSTDSRFAVSSATYTIPAGGGAASFYFGGFRIAAAYSGSDSSLPSRGNAGFRVSSPKFKTLKHGIRVATVIAGTGAGITSGQTASMLYTGYLRHHGALFDTSANHSGTPLSFKVNASPEQVVPGFDEGTVGMTIGETRVLEIPSAFAYGATASNGIPANADLVFVITLEGIS